MKLLSKYLSGREGLVDKVQKLNILRMDAMRRIEESLKHFEKDLITYRKTSAHELVIKLVNLHNMPFYVMVYSVGVKRLFMEWGYYFEDEVDFVQRQKVTKAEIVTQNNELLFKDDSFLQPLSRLAANKFIDKVADAISRSDIRIVFCKEPDRVVLVTEERMQKTSEYKETEFLK